MSSNLRVYSAPVGYFVIGTDTLPDGSSSGLYELSSATVYANDGTVTTAGVFKWTDKVALQVTNGATITLKDLGKTEYGVYVQDRGSAARLGPVDIRKVRIASGTTVEEDAAYYVSLGTNLRTSDPGTFVSTKKASVAMFGKLF
jgi:hypothetical protein